jgi:hypothetical protein
MGAFSDMLAEIGRSNLAPSLSQDEIEWQLAEFNEYFKKRAKDFQPMSQSEIERHLAEHQELVGQQDLDRRVPARKLRVYPILAKIHHRAKNVNGL